MSCLKRTGSVVFDPALAEHRRAVRSFMKRNAWGDSPIRFRHDPAYGNVANQVQIKLLKWYLEQEEVKDQKSAERKSVRTKTRTDNVKFIQSFIKKQNDNCHRIEEST